jgi:hypothetical protein
LPMPRLATLPDDFAPNSLSATPLALSGYPVLSHKTKFYGRMNRMHSAHRAQPRRAISMIDHCWDIKSIRIGDTL